MMAGTILVEVTKEVFLINYIEIGPVVTDKKIFKVFLLVAVTTRLLH